MTACGQPDENDTGPILGIAYAFGALAFLSTLGRLYTRFKGVGGRFWYDDMLIVLATVYTLTPCLVYLLLTSHHSLQSLLTSWHKLKVSQIVPTGSLRAIFLTCVLVTRNGLTHNIWHVNLDNIDYILLVQFGMLLVLLCSFSDWH